MPDGQVVEAGLGIDGGVDHHLAPQCDARGFLQKPERKGGREGEAVLAIGAALGEAHLHVLLERGAAGDQREVDAGFEHRAAGLPDGFHANGKRRHEPLLVAHEKLSGNRAAGRDVFGNQKIELQSGQTEAAHEARDQQCREHRSHDQEQQVIGGDDGPHPHQYDGGGKQHSAAGDPVADAAAEGMPELSPQVAHGRFDCSPPAGAAAERESTPELRTS